MSLLRRRAKSRSCHIHGDNGCEIQGEAGKRSRADDKRVWRRDVRDELRALCIGAGSILDLSGRSTVRAVRVQRRRRGDLADGWNRVGGRPA